MNSVFSQSLSQAVSITLLHSLWQGLIIILLLKCILATISSRHSSRRYGICAAALILFLIISVTTFCVYFQPLPTAASNARSGLLTFVDHAIAPGMEISNAEKIAAIIATYHAEICTVWLVGAMMFLLRLAGGWALLMKTRAGAKLLSNELSSRLNDLSKMLGVRIKVMLAESCDVESPMVIGILKPMILIPAGLASGLSIEQLDAILIHELVHIRRKDFLFNVAQSVMEALYFFNPFVWMISTAMRSEREHCCDDAVINSGVDARSYVFTLASLEERKLSRHGLAVPLSGNKNQLLTRIKRLMEKSVQKYTLRDRLVPLIILAAGLMCASWFSIQKNDSSLHYQRDEQITPADTVIKKKGKNTSHSKKKESSKKKEIKSSQDAMPYKEPQEIFDRDLDGWTAMGEYEHLTVPPIPQFELELALPPMPERGFMDLNLPPMRVDVGTLLPHSFSQQSLEKFQLEFQEKFKDRFGDFYQENQEEIQQLMKELQEKYRVEQMDRLQVLQEELRANSESLANTARQMERHRESLEQQRHRFADVEERMKAREAENATRMKALNEEMKKFEEKMTAFQKELKDELVRDGYLESGEEIRNIHWDDEGKIDVNGTAIKPSDREKYDDIHKKHFGNRPGRFHYAK